MRKLFFAVLVPGLMAMSAGTAYATTGDDLMSGIPTPPDSRSLGSEAIASGGQHAAYSTSASPASVIAAYKQSLLQAGWTVTGSSGSGSSWGGGGGLQATNGPKYLSVNAGGPAGTTYVDVCVWPSRPHNDNCGND
jgi:hypothetical protein